MYFVQFTTVFVFHFYPQPTSQQNVRTNFQIHRLELCNKTQGLIHFDGNVTKEGNNYYTSYNIRTPIPIDEHVGLRVKIDSKVANSYVELFVLHEKYFCKAANIYGGEFWYDLQRAAQMIQGLCPMTPGHYHVHHLLLDFRKISLQTFPFGEMRFTGGLIDNKYPHTYLLCLVAEVENVFN